MDFLAEKLNVKLCQWQPDISAQVRQSIAEIIEMADQGTLDISRSRMIEQEVLDLLDEPGKDDRIDSRFERLFS